MELRSQGYLHKISKSRVLSLFWVFGTLALAMQVNREFPTHDEKHHHWRLVKSQVEPVSGKKPTQQLPDVSVSDPVMSVLTYPKTVASSGEWSIYANGFSNSDGSIANKTSQTIMFPVSCTPFTNTTQYDHLRGLTSRSSLPFYREPEVFAVFKKGNMVPKLEEILKNITDNLSLKPKEPQNLNQAGNLLRVYGDTLGAVECFRKALFYSPNNPDVLLNLARVLFNHKFLDDALYLARRSLETQPPDRNPWLQHFTLGEILRATSQEAEAAHHLRHSLSLKPDFQPALRHLRQLEPGGQPSLTLYTLAIIAFLVLGVLATLLTTAEANLDSYGEVMKTQRHFNRAMAMAKISINNKIIRPNKRGSPVKND